MSAVALASWRDTPAKQAIIDVVEPLTRAASDGWTVISIKNDWSSVF